MGSVLTFRAQGADLVRLNIEANTLDEATLQLDHGVYTVFRLYPGQRVFRLGAHLARLRRSADLLGQPFPLEDGWLRDALRRAVDASGIAIPRLRLTVPFTAPDSALIMLQPFMPPPDVYYREGVKVTLVDLQRDLPRAKNSQFIQQRQAVLAAKTPDAYELIMVNGDGVLREGTSSNFYTVLDGRLHTAEARVLEGIARGLIFEVAPDVIPLSTEPVHRDALPRIQEAMISSSSRGILPVVQIDQAVIGDGKPGPVYLELSRRYNARIEQELEPL